MASGSAETRFSLDAGRQVPLFRADGVETARWRSVRSPRLKRRAGLADPATRPRSDDRDGACEVDLRRPDVDAYGRADLRARFPARRHHDAAPKPSVYTCYGFTAELRAYSAIAQP